MPTSIPPDVMERLRERVHQPPKPPTEWGKVIVMLLVIGLVGWLGYKYWRERTPIERDITLQGGKVLHATIIGRSERLLQITLPGSTKPVFLPVASLSPADQVFANGILANLKVKFPLDYDLTDPLGKTVAVRLEIRDADWVQLTYLSNQLDTCMPISSLSELDQTVVRLMPPTTFSYPVDYVFTAPPAAGSQVQISGHDQRVVSYILSADGSTNYYPMEDLSDTDQAFVNHLSDWLDFSWPLDCTVRFTNGIPVKIHAVGRVGSFLVLNDPLNGTTDYRLIADFSQPDQKIFYLLTSRKLPEYPFDFTLVDASKKSLPVSVLGRSDSVVQFKMGNGTVSTYPLDKLSSENQQFLLMLEDNMSPPAQKPEIKALQDEIARLQKQNLLFQAEIAAPDTSYIQAQMDQRQIKSNQAQIDSDQLKIQADNLQ